jgi:hypothetical protein
MTRVMRAPRTAGNASDATISLYVRCGSAVMRQILEVGELLSGFGRGIFVGFNLFLSIICFLVVRTSQIGVSLML